MSAQRHQSDQEATVVLGTEKVTLRVPRDVVAWFRARAISSDTSMRLACILRLCWASPDRPAHSMPPFDGEETGGAVVRELYERGASVTEIDAATVKAWVLCRDWFEGRPSATDDDGGKPTDEAEEVSEVADFSEAPAPGSGSK